MSRTMLRVALYLLFSMVGVAMIIKRACEHKFWFGMEGLFGPNKLRRDTTLTVGREDKLV